MEHKRVRRGIAARRELALLHQTLSRQCSSSLARTRDLKVVLLADWECYKGIPKYKHDEKCNVIIRLWASSCTWICVQAKEERMQIFS